MWAGLLAGQPVWQCIATAVSQAVWSYCVIFEVRRISCISDVTDAMQWLHGWLARLHIPKGPKTDVMTACITGGIPAVNYLNITIHFSIPCISNLGMTPAMAVDQRTSTW